MMLSAMVTVSEANTPSTLEVTMKSSSSFNVSYKGPGNRTVQITITDGQGKTLASRMVKNTQQFNLPVSLKDATPGKYYVIANDGTEKIVKEVWTSKTTTSFQNARKLYSHVADLGGGKYLLTMRSFVSEQPVKIRIYDASNRLVQSETASVNGEKAMVFNTKKVKGAVSFVVSDPTGRSEIVQN